MIKLRANILWPVKGSDGHFIIFRQEMIQSAVDIMRKCWKCRIYAASLYEWSLPWGVYRFGLPIKLIACTISMEKDILCIHAIAAGYIRNNRIYFKKERERDQNNINLRNRITGKYNLVTCVIICAHVPDVYS